ncbi:MAG: amidohydrolase [Selenomonadaceae bacterium]|nr:amidohydrolase [Selenomonadaceae bacterium]
MPFENEFIIHDVKYFQPDGKVAEGNIFIQGDKISRITPPSNISEMQSANVIDGRGKFATPGLINTHTHASMTLLRSYADDLALMDWLNDHIWPIEAKMKRKDIYFGAALAAVEMIKCGTTAFMDMYGPCMEEVAKVVEESGMRGALCRGIIGIFDGDEKLQTNVDLFKNFNGAANGRIKVMFGPHAIYTCPPDFLRKICETAGSLGAEIHMHMNETLDEINGCMKDYGKRPFEVVAETGLLDLGFLAAHCVHLSDNEIEIMKAKKVRVAHNPTSNMKLASGIAPVDKMLKAGLTVGIGTDGASSNNNLDMLEETRLAALLAKINTMSPLTLPADTALKMATEEGAKAINFDYKVGRLEVGYKADITLWDMRGVEWQPNYNPVSLLIYSAISSSADTVIVDGKILMQNRELKTLDEEKIIHEFNACADRLTGKS